MAGRTRPFEFRARLFDADRTDHEVKLTPALAKDLSDRQLLWVDATGEVEPGALKQLSALLPTHPEELAGVWGGEGGPRLDLHGDHFLLRVVALDAQDRGRGEVLDVLAARNLVITHHTGPLAVLGALDERIKSDTPLGQIDSTGFVAAILEALVTEYLSGVDEVEAAVDRLDAEALRTTSRDLLDGMVDLRHRIARLRRQLTAHRGVFSALAGADFEAVTASESSARYRPLLERFQGAIDAVDAGREALVGTFDIHMTRTSQRTNDIMKTLTIVNVLLLPAVVIAGFMGMNEKTPFSEDDPMVFWVVVALIIVLAVVTLIVLRLRRWL